MTEENRETWLVSLWLNNDEQMYKTAISILSKKFKYEHLRLEALAEYVEELTDERLITDKFSPERVDWVSVAKDFDEVLEIEHN